ncbi:MAG: BrnT family toxin [Acidobacteria bacterium]|nr:BrnT family toxin [Acidobacteriota bacterium]
MVYEWHAAKAKANLHKHGVSFEDAAAVFLDPLALTFSDPYQSGEEREITIGYTAGHQVVFVSHCQRGNRVRIISARKATRRERSQYEEGISKEIG